MTTQGTVTPCSLLPSKLTQLKSCLIGETIDIYVGEKAKRYTIHKGLLTQYEWFRKEIFYYGNDTGSRKCISLRTEEPKVFELLICWLYRKKLNAISDNEFFAKKEAKLYVELYLKACVWEIHELQNALMDQLRFRRTCELGYFPRHTIGRVYTWTSSQSPLRSYIVDSFIYKGIEWNEDGGIKDPIDTDFILTRQRALKNQLDAGNQEFVLDCYEALFQLCAKSKIRDPDRRTGCVYHTHKEGEKCRP